MHTSTNNTALEALLLEIGGCTLCSAHLPNAPRPVLRVGVKARLLIIGQAPGTRVHASGIPWNDPSGDRLRQWLGLSEEQFYNQESIAIMPMGFCYPGKGKSGDLPPRPECAKTWHERVLQLLPEVRCTLLIGQYAQRHYLDDDYPTLQERVRNWQDYAPEYFVLPHPSPRNHLWRQRNPWFETKIVPALRKTVKELLEL